MKKTIVVFLFLFTSVCSFSQVIDEIVAVVGDEIVLASDVETQYLQYLSQGYTEKEEVRCQIIEDLLYQNLLSHQAKLDSVDV